MAPNIGEFCLAAQLRPHLVDRFSRRMDEVDTAARVAAGSLVGVTLCFGMPDRFHVQQAAVSSTEVVLSKLESRAPSCSFEFATVGLLQDGAVLALTQQALTRRGQSSGGHGGHLEPRALWSVSPDCL